MPSTTRRAQLRYQWAGATHAWWPAGPGGIAVPVQVVQLRGKVTDVRNFHGDVHDVPTNQLSRLAD